MSTVKNPTFTFDITQIQARFFPMQSIFSSPDPGELMSPLSVRRPSSVRPLSFHILINSSEATGPI
jgi:hypothetical protein